MSTHCLYPLPRTVSVPREVEAGGSHVHSLPGLYSEIKASLGNLLIFCLKQNKIPKPSQTQGLGAVTQWYPVCLTCQKPRLQSLVVAIVGIKGGNYLTASSSSFSTFFFWEQKPSVIWRVNPKTQNQNTFLNTEQSQL